MSLSIFASTLDTDLTPLGYGNELTFNGHGLPLGDPAGGSWVGIELFPGGADVPPHFAVTHIVEAAANATFGTLRAGARNTVDVFGGSYDRSSASATASFIDRFVLEGPLEGSVANLNPHLLIEGLYFSGSDWPAPSSARLEMFLDLSPDSDNSDFFTESALAGSWEIRGIGNFDGAANVSFPYSVPVGQEFELGFRLQATAGALGAVVDFIDTISLDPSKPFSVPAGLSLYSESGTPTGFTRGQAVPDRLPAVFVLLFLTLTCVVRRREGAV